MFCVAFACFHFRTHWNEVHEEGNEHADQGVEHAVEGETRNAAIGAVGDGDAQEGDAGDVGQGAFAHELGEKDKGCDGTETVVPEFVQDVGKGFSLEGLCQEHEGDDTEGNQEVFECREGKEGKFPKDKQDSHSCETADQGSDRPVHADPERAFYFRLETDDGCDARIKGNACADIEKLVNQAADENGQRRFDNQFSHGMKGDRFCSGQTLREVSLPLWKDSSHSAKLKDCSCIYSRTSSNQVLKI